MVLFQDYYATAHYFFHDGKGTVAFPVRHRYFIFSGFDEETIRLVDERTLRAEWTLTSGKREKVDFDRSEEGRRELSEISVYTGQVYKRTPLKKTFLIGLSEFRSVLLDTSLAMPGMVRSSGLMSMRP